MFNERNQRVDEAPPSTPVVILGLNGAPQAGEKFKMYEDEAEAKEVALKRAQILREQGLRARKHITLDEIGRRLALGNFKELNVIIKGDVDGSVEALSDSLQKLSTQEILVSVVHKGVGQISESDVLLATASDAIVIGFNVRPSAQANKLAETEGVQIKMYSIIYTAIDEIKSAMEGMLEPKVEEKEVVVAEPKANAIDPPIKLSWPAKGKVVEEFNEAKNKGIDIAGKMGEPIQAAADGKVVYAGNSLRGYGNLVIVKHDNTYLTAYAHNRTLLVKEGENVRKGQRIAEMGDSDANMVKLHFEVRMNGKPVNPMQYLQ